MEFACAVFRSCRVGGLNDVIVGGATVKIGDVVAALEIARGCSLLKIVVN